MTETAESYVGSLRPQMEEIVARQAQVSRVAAMLQGLVREHVTYDAGGDDQPARIPGADWNGTGEHMWIGLFGPGKTPINKGDADGDVWPLVDSADVIVMGEDGSPHDAGVTVATIQLNPRNVFGPDGSPLNAGQVASLVDDLWLYEEALPASRQSATD